MDLEVADTDALDQALSLYLFHLPPDRRYIWQRRLIVVNEIQVNIRYSKLFQAIVNRCVNVHFRVVRVESRKFRSYVDFTTTEATFTYGFYSLLFVPIHGRSIYVVEADRYGLCYMGSCKLIWNFPCTKADVCS